MEKIFNEKVPYLISTSCEYKHPTPQPFASSRSMANWKEGVLSVARVTTFTNAARFMGLPERGEPPSTDPAALATFIRETFYPSVLTTSDVSFVREQGLLPHERSLNKEEDVEEERRLCFVGMTRAMKELYLSHARLREFRGQLNYAIPSSFLQELPPEVEHVDVSQSKNFARSAADEWRAKVGPAARDWADTGARPYLPPRKPAELKPTIPDPPDTGLGSL